MMKYLAVSLLSLFLLSCGGEAGRCDFRSGGTNDARCQEWSSTLPNAKMSYEQACTASGGVYADEDCPKEDSVGGCKQNTNNADGSEMTDYYYPPLTVDEAKNKCNGDGEEYIAL